MIEQNHIEIYKTNSGTEIRINLEQGSLWLDAHAIATLFAVQPPANVKHISNIYKTGELEKEASCSILEQLAADGKKRKMNLYNLDMIISVGYRVNSLKATQFRRWATQRLKDYLLQGYALNEQRFQKNAAELRQAIQLIKKAAASDSISRDAGCGLVHIISHYTQTFLWLQQYDEGLLEDPKGTLGGDLPSAKEAMQALLELKQRLIERGEATALFAHVRETGLEGIFGNLNQSVFGEPAYPTVESKAAHLLYFVVKNHPFSDGNKRSGAFLFVDFLNRNGRLFNDSGESIINDTGLAALTLLVAESDAKQKETMIRLIINLLARNDSGS